MDRLSFMVRYVPLLVAALTLEKCPWEAASGQRPTTTPAQVAQFVYRATNAQQCPCHAVTNSTTYAYLQNLQPTKAILATYRITTVDLQSDAEIDTSEPIQTYPDLEPGETRPMGCSIVPDESLGDNPTRERLATVCRVRHRYRLLGSSVTSRISYADEVVPVAADDLTGPEFCRAQCEKGNPNCVDLGSRNAAIAAPFVGFMDAAAKGGNRTYPAAELYARMGTSSNATQCRRGDLVVTGDRVRNAGETACVIERSSIAALMSSLSPRQKLDMLWGPFDVNLELPKTIAMDRRAAIDAPPGMAGLFSNADESMVISFSPSPLAMQLAPDANRMNELYSGYVRDVSYGRRDDGGRIMVLSTPRGCIKLDAPEP